jgi:LmbE family N-acetylglucosaminyl deacetylase
MKRLIACSILLFLLRAAVALAQIPEAPPNPPPDAQFKADMLLVLAHPDDEGFPEAAYLAKAIFDEHKRVAVVFTSFGQADGNRIGYEEAAALALEREIDGRTALQSSLGVTNTFFLGGPDCGSQDVLRALAMMNHGAALSQLVRIVRLTRPDVIVTMLPAYAVGENHGDHQAAAVMATEAFDLAGDPTVYPEQVTAPRNRFTINNLTDGLHAWQAKKLYFLYDPRRPDFLGTEGPKYSNTEISPSRGVPYTKFIADDLSVHHVSVPDFAKGSRNFQAFTTGDLQSAVHWIPSRFEFTEFVFGKSLVKGSITGDVFEGVGPGPIPYAPPRSYRASPRTGLTAELGGPWAFYHDFWTIHGLDNLAQIFQNPVVGIGINQTLHLPILIHNDTDRDAEVTLTAALPPGWKEISGTARYHVAAHDVYPAPTYCTVPDVESQADPQIITWTAQADGKHVGTISVRVWVAHHTLPQ